MDENIKAIVRCINCKYAVRNKEGELNPRDIICSMWCSDGFEAGDYCSRGEEGVYMSDDNCIQDQKGYDLITNSENDNDTRSVNDWISTNERLPESGRDVLIYYPEWNEIQIARLDYDGIVFDIFGEFEIGARYITHWMPLPEPPKEEK